MNDITYMQIEVTTRCNFNCVFCSGRHMEQRDMDFETVKKAIDMFPHLKDIVLQGEGEPLLNPSFFDMATYAKNAGLNVITITNGSLLTDENIMKLLESKIDVVYISIEAPDSELYKSIRRGGDYNKLVSNLQRFVQLRNENNLGKLKIGFAITVIRKTKDMFEKILKLYQELGLDAGVMYNCLIKVSHYTKNYGDDLNNQAFTPAEEKLIFYKNDKLLNQYNINFGAQPKYDNFSNCIWLDHRISINLHGSCMRCPFDKDDTGFVYGNIHNNTYEEIMESKRKLLNKEHKLPETLNCYNCAIYK